MTPWEPSASPDPPASPRCRVGLNTASGASAFRHPPARPRQTRTPPTLPARCREGLCHRGLPAPAPGTPRRPWPVPRATAQPRPGAGPARQRRSPRTQHEDATRVSASLARGHRHAPAWGERGTGPRGLACGAAAYALGWSCLCCGRTSAAMQGACTPRRSTVPRRVVRSRVARRPPTWSRVAWPYAFPLWVFLPRPWRPTPRFRRRR